MQNCSGITSLVAILPFAAWDFVVVVVVVVVVAAAAAAVVVVVVVVDCQLFHALDHVHMCI